MTSKREWVNGRRNWTRDQQKVRIATWFIERCKKGNLEKATAQAVANGLNMISVSTIKDICEEMVTDGFLFKENVIHRTRKDGSQIIKTLYLPVNASQWLDDRQLAEQMELF